MRLPALLLFVLVATAAGQAHPEIEAGLTRLNAAIAAAPRDAELYLERGELYSRHEDWVSAEANFLVAAELAPAHPDIDRARGALALATRQPAAARAFFDAALARRPDDTASLILRARAYAALGERRAAVADYDRALPRLAAPSPELFLAKAALLDPAEALVCLDAAIVRIGPVPTLQLQAAACEESLGRIDAAARRFARLAGQSERQETWLKAQGDLYARTGRQLEAKAAYAAALGAIARLPDWLRESPDTARLAGQLSTLAAASP